MIGMIVCFVGGFNLGRGISTDNANLMMLGVGLIIIGFLMPV